MTEIKKYQTSDEEYKNSEGEDDSVYYVGSKEDIKAMYKSIARNRNTDIKPYFCDFPKFSDSRNIYALCIDKNNWMTVVNSDTMLLFIVKGYVIPA